jgi:two-component system, response regulator PdtaR
MVVGQKVILVAEDDVLVRLVAVDRLIEAGFSVLEAEHADAALLILNVQAADVHVLFTDIHMPGSMNGLALAHHAHQHFPWIALLVASGDARPGKKDLPEGCRFLAKPYDPGHAIASICELLRQPPLSGPSVPPWLAS